MSFKLLTEKKKYILFSVKKIFLKNTTSLKFILKYKLFL